MLELEAETAKLRHFIETVGISRLESRIVKAARPAVRLNTSRARGRIAPGATKVGGVPDLPSGVAWPDFDGVPFSFLGQINLDEVASHITLNGRGPTNGLLSFFLDMSGSKTFGFGDACRIVLSTGAVAPREPPHGAHQFPQCAVELLPMLDIPSPTERPDFAELDSQDRSKYRTLVDAWDRGTLDFDAPGRRRPRHVFLGYPRTVQLGDLRYRVCRLPPKELPPVKARNPFTGEIIMLPDQRRFDDEALSLEHVMQFAEDPAAEMVWIDSGVATFFAESAQLRRGEVGEARVAIDFG